MRLSRSTLSSFRGGASGLGLPRYVGWRSSHATSSSPPSWPATKSYSQLTVLCSLPSSLRGRTSSLRTSVYFLPSAPGANLRDKPEYGDRFQGPAESEVRWEAKPAPPRVVMSSVP